MPERVAALGYECVTLADFYGNEQAAQDAADTAWLAAAAPYGYVILTRDGNLYVNDHEREIVERFKYRVFWLGPKKGPGRAWADRFEQFHAAIAGHAGNQGPYLVKVQQAGLEHAWP